MNNFEQAKKEDKGECVMCKFVLIFSFVALLFVLILIFFMRTPSAAPIGI